MSDLFAEDVSAEDFALPGDDARMGRVVEPEPVEVETEHEEQPAVEETQPRNPDGTFAPREVEEAPEVVEETPAETLLAGNFKSVEDLERAYEDLRQLNGRQSSELGDLRKAFEDKFAQLDERLNAPAPTQITSDLIDANPARAAQLAYQQDDGEAFALALEQWKIDDPFAAATWVNAKNTEIREAEWRAELDQRFNEAETRATAPAQVTSLLAEKAATLPGFGEFIQSGRVAELANDFPEEADTILKGTPAQKARAFEKLFLIDGGRRGDNLRVTQEQAARQTAEEAAKVREEAYVASATTTTSAAKLSKAEEIGAEWDAMEAPYNEGWNV